MIKNFKNQFGLTLIEILVAMSISVVVGGLLLVIMTNSSGLFFKQSSKISQGVKTNDALVALRQNIKQANSISPGFSVYTSGQEQLVLEVSSINSSGNIIPDTNDYYVFFKDNNYLRFKIYPNELSQRKSMNQVLATFVDKILFEYFNNANPPVSVAPNVATKIKITLVLEQKTLTDSEQSIATSEANLRND